MRQAAAERAGRRLPGQFVAPEKGGKVLGRHLLLSQSLQAGGGHVDAAIPLNRLAILVETNRRKERRIIAQRGKESKFSNQRGKIDCFRSAGASAFEPTHIHRQVSRYRHRGKTWQRDARRNHLNRVHSEDRHSRLGSEYAMNAHFFKPAQSLNERSRAECLSLCRSFGGMIEKRFDEADARWPPPPGSSGRSLRRRSLR